MWIFWTFSELYFNIWSKKHCFLLKISENVFSWLSLLKKNMKKSSIFWKKRGLTLLKDLDFLDCFETSLLRSKKCSLLFRISKNVSFWVSLLKKKHIRKRSIFLQKPWTNPFAKCHFSGLKSILFYPEYQKMFLSGLFLLKKDIEKKVYFVTKKPFKNIDFLIFYRTSLLRSIRHSFLSLILKKCVFFRFFCKTWEKGRFFDLL